MVKDLDLDGRSLNELEEIHEAVMRAKEKHTIEKQNELIRAYQALRTDMVRYGVAKEDELPRFKIRGWTRGGPKAN